jgi:hypothetical protein
MQTGASIQIGHSGSTEFQSASAAVRNPTSLHDVYRSKNHMTRFEMNPTFVAGLSVLLFASSPIVKATQPSGRTEAHTATAEAPERPPSLNPEAPSETALLGRLVGLWEASMVRRNPDGSWQDRATRYLWRWYFILDGHAIQDDWIRVRNGSETNPGQSHRVIGTNIRIYNPDEQQWHMAWIDSGQRRLATFTAANVDGSIVMTGRNAMGRQVRNTFSNITNQSFNWVQEWTADDGATWFEVAKIHCRRLE